MQGKILEKKLLEMLREDVGFSDITTAFTPKRKVRAEIIAKDEGIVSGISELGQLFRSFNIEAACRLRDGGRVKKKQAIYSLEGDSRDILIVERTALNILSRMSGISTLTRKYVDAASLGDPRVRIAATRKTTPCFAYFEKKAVAAGGGDTHRLSLQDEVLIKDNHLRLFGSVAEALKAAKKETSFTHKIEIEVSTAKDAIIAAENGADIVMLDNMPAAEIKRTVKQMEAKGVREKVLIEASGGINLENVAEYARTGVDVISIGRLTHSAPALDVSLEIL